MKFKRDSNLIKLLEEVSSVVTRGFVVQHIPKSGGTSLHKTIQNHVYSTHLESSLIEKKIWLGCVRQYTCTHLLCKLQTTPVRKFLEKSETSDLWWITLEHDSISNQILEKIPSNARLLLLFRDTESRLISLMNFHFERDRFFRTSASFSIPFVKVAYFNASFDGPDLIRNRMNFVFVSHLMHKRLRDMSRALAPHIRRGKFTPSYFDAVLGNDYFFYVDLLPRMPFEQEKFSKLLVVPTEDLDQFTLELFGVKKRVNTSQRKQDLNHETSTLLGSWHKSPHFLPEKKAEARLSQLSRTWREGLGDFLANPSGGK